MTSKYTYVDCRSLHNGVWFNYCKCIHCLRYSRSIILYHMPGLVNKGNSTPNEDKNKKKRSMLNFCWPFSKLDKNSLIYESSKIEIIKLLRDIISIKDHKIQSERTVQNRALPLLMYLFNHARMWTKPTRNKFSLNKWLVYMYEFKYKSITG